MTEQPSVSLGAALEKQDFADKQRGLLELIDTLQFAQLDNVKLPQIVVVGDQSAGKSSVLEAVTQMPFERSAGACTRFATEIRLRRSPNPGFSVSIIPDRTNRTTEEQQRLLQFGNSMDASTSFEVLTRLAIDQIAPRNVPGRFATGDILVVEQRGPNLPLLTVVDLPGLVRVANNDQSTADIKAINDLTDKYMKSSRTIILAVVGGNQDFVQAPVLEKARRWDPSGERTIGVLTKPDLTARLGLEAKFIALINNEDRHNRFRLGWYVLLNPGPREPSQPWPSPEERKRNEDNFFAAGNWSTLPPDVCGATALKQKLSLQLQQHIGKHVSALRKEIQQAHDNCVAELKGLGSGKDTVAEMREEFGQLCSDSKDLVTPAVHGWYKDPSDRTFFPKPVDPKGIPPQKLRARAVYENKQFAARLRLEGRKSQLVFEDDAQDSQREKAAKKEFARAEVEPLLAQNTGTELPSDYNPRVVYILFQTHSEAWPKLAQDHKDNLGIICNEFMGEVIGHVWPSRMREPLIARFLDPHVKVLMVKAQEELDALRRDLNLEIQPYDAEYDRRLKKLREEASNEEPLTVAEEVLEKMLIYYDLVAKTYIRNVVTQVVERHLLQGLIQVFSWANIAKVDDETIVAIAAENQETRERRLALRDQKAAIERSLNICARLAMRKELRTSTGREFERAKASDDDEVATPTSPSQRRSSQQGHQRRHSHAPASPTAPPPMPPGSRPSAAPANPDRARDHPREAGTDHRRTPNGTAPGPSRDAGPRVDLPHLPGGWSEDLATDRGAFAQTQFNTVLPDRAPPSPPRPERNGAQSRADRAPAQPDRNNGRMPPPVPVGLYPRENGHEQPGAYDFLAADAREPPRRPGRRLFGSRG